MIDLIISLIFGILFGILLQRSGFCMVSGLAEAFTAREYGTLKIWLLIVLVSMIGFYSAWQLGVVKSVWTVPLRGSGWFNLIGGFIFGIGMVLAGGCAVGTLYKVGEGQVASLLALVGIFVGVALYFSFAAPVLKGYYAHQMLTFPVYLKINPWILIGSILAIICVAFGMRRIRA